MTRWDLNLSPLWGRGGSPIAPRLLCLHWLTAEPDPGEGYRPRAYTRPEELERLVEVIRPIGSYGAVWWGGQVRLGVEPGRKAGHAAGSEGLADANANSFGLAIPYLSPSYNPRGIPGEQELPFVVHSTGEQRTAYYPPLDEDMLRECVQWARDFFLAQGWAPAGVITPAMINPRKNDITNLGTRLHGDLTALFLGLS